MSELRIVAVPRERFDELETLWRSLYQHHNELTPHLRERVRPFEAAWASRREMERNWLDAEPQSFALAAMEADRYVGYAFVRVISGADFAASWNVSDPRGELVTLAVLPEHRGQGIGSALLTAVEAKLRELRVNDMVVAVISTNANAARLYERRGAVAFLTEYIQGVRAE
jgi:ribosomal protein S18 acetylase RimI-like enzyme